MDEDLQFFFWVVGVLGWLMCFCHSYNWVREDCGCKHESTSQYNSEDVIVAIPIDQE